MGSMEKRGLQGPSTHRFGSTREANTDLSPPPFPASTLAHELAHIALTSLDNVTWADDSTPFVHILTHIGTQRLARQSVAGPGPVSSVTATDLNRRYLIRTALDNACTLAKINSDFARPVLP